MFWNLIQSQFQDPKPEAFPLSSLSTVDPYQEWSKKRRSIIINIMSFHQVELLCHVRIQLVRETFLTYKQINNSYSFQRRAYFSLSRNTSFLLPQWLKWRAGQEARDYKEAVIVNPYLFLWSLLCFWNKHIFSIKTDFFFLFNHLQKAVTSGYLKIHFLLIQAEKTLLA